MKSDFEVDVNIKKLTHSNPFVRKTGAQALGRHRVYAALPFLQKALVEENDPKTLKWMALALAQIGSLDSLAVVQYQLNRIVDDDARDWLYVSAGMLNKSSNLDRTQQLLQSSSIQSQQEGALIAWGLKDVPDIIVKQLISEANHPDPKVRRWSILSLGEIRGLRSSSPILHGLYDDDYLIKEWTLCTLSKIRDPQAFPHLIKCLGDQHPRVREWAVKALSKLDFEWIPDLLIEGYANEPDELCREGTIRSLGEHFSKESVRRFILPLFKSETSEIAKVALIETVSSSSAAKSDPDIIEALMDISSSELDGAFQAQIVSALISSFTNDDRASLSRFLGSRKLRLIFEMLRSDNKAVANLTATYLGEQRQHIWSGFRQEETNEMVRPDVGIVIALKEEFREFHRQIEQSIIPAEDPELGALYYFFEHEGPDGSSPYHCVVTMIGEKGPEEAALVTDRLITRWKPATIVMLGIAAGIHDDVKVGDVVVARQVDSYITSAKAVPSKNKTEFRFQFSGAVFRGSADLIDRIINLEFVQKQAFERWRNVCQHFLETLVPKQVQSKLVRSKLIRERVSLEDVHLASGPVVTASTAFLDWLHRRDRDYKALEMESVGLMIAAYRRVHPIPTLVVRGISDYGDHRKAMLDKIQDGALRLYAMHNATQLLWTLLDVKALPQKPHESKS